MIAEDPVQGGIHARGESTRRFADGLLLHAPFLKDGSRVKQGAAAVVDRLVHAGDDSVVRDLYESRRTSKEGNTPQDRERLAGDCLMHLAYARRGLLHRDLGRLAAARARLVADGPGL